MRVKSRAFDGWHQREWASVHDISQFMQERMATDRCEGLVAEGKDPGSTSIGILRFENYPVITNIKLTAMIDMLSTTLGFPLVQIGKKAERNPGIVQVLAPRDEKGFR